VPLEGSERYDAPKLSPGVRTPRARQRLLQRAARQQAFRLWLHQHKMRQSEDSWQLFLAEEQEQQLYLQDRGYLEWLGQVGLSNDRVTHQLWVMMQKRQPQPTAFPVWLEAREAAPTGESYQEWLSDQGVAREQKQLYQLWLGQRGLSHSAKTFDAFVQRQGTTWEPGAPQGQEDIKQRATTMETAPQQAPQQDEADPSPAQGAEVEQAKAVEAVEAKAVEAVEAVEAGTVAEEREPAEKVLEPVCRVCGTWGPQADSSCCCGVVFVGAKDHFHVHSFTASCHCKRLQETSAPPAESPAQSPAEAPPASGTGCGPSGCAN
jgi:hypothetical protein